MSDNESSEDGLKPFQFAPISDTLLTAPVPWPVGNGNYIFPISALQQPPSGPAPSTNVSTMTDYPDFNHYRHLLQYRGPHGTENTNIHHPAKEDVGDGSAWYYVTVGGRVGVFNT